MDENFHIKSSMFWWLFTGILVLQISIHWILKGGYRVPPWRAAGVAAVIKPNNYENPLWFPQNVHVISIGFVRMTHLCFLPCIGLQWCITVVQTPLVRVEQMVDSMQQASGDGWYKGYAPWPARQQKRKAINPEQPCTWITLYIHAACY